MCDLPPETVRSLAATSNPYSPTAARAGSAEKIDVLARRHQAGAPLWHPDDNPEQSGPSQHDPER